MTQRIELGRATAASRELLAEVLTTSGGGHVTFELVTTDGLRFTLADPSEEDGRIVTKVNLDSDGLLARQDLRSIDGCPVDFAVSAGIGEEEGINLRVFVGNGSIASLRLPGIVRVAPC